MGKYIGLTVDMTIEPVELTGQDLKDLEAGDLSFLDMDFHYIFLEEGSWDSFKAKVNQF